MEKRKILTFIDWSYIYGNFKNKIAVGKVLKLLLVVLYMLILIVVIWLFRLGI